MQQKRKKKQPRFLSFCHSPPVLPACVYTSDVIQILNAVADALLIPIMYSSHFSCCNKTS